MKIYISIASVLITLVATAAIAQQGSSCTTPEHRQFDFWVGDWDVFGSDGVTKAARVRVDKILGGCVLLEKYEDSTGLEGQSFSIYDSFRKVWHQTWTTNRGQLLIIEGPMQARELTMMGKHSGPAGEELVRGTWRPAADGVRETAAKSLDNGKSWQPWFDLTFRPRPNIATATEDMKIVAGLDTQYQAADKANDSSTIDRLLADDFLLITGTGKRITKADLVAEARSGNVRYEKQDELEQSVRVWGDTAVVTAKLWEKGLRTEKRLITNFGSVIHTCAHLQDGNTS